MCTHPAEHFNAYCHPLRVPLATRFASRAQTFRLALKGTGRERKMGTICSITASSQMQPLLTGKLILLFARKGRIKHKSPTTMSHSSLYLALRCFPLLDHALSSAWPYLALHCFTLLGLPLPCAPCIALLCFALRCLGLQCSALLCFAWPFFALLCPSVPASTRGCAH